VGIPKRTTAAGIWTDLREFIRRNRTQITTLECRDSVENGFDLFVDAVQHGGTLSLEAASFGGSAYDKKFVDSVVRFATSHHSLNSVEIDGGLTSEGAAAALRLCEVRNVGRLSFLNNPLLNVGVLIDRIDRIKKLNISNCGCDIFVILHGLSKRRECQLGHLNAGGNKSIQPLPAELRLPISLNSFCFGNCEWQNGNLKKLMLILSSHRIDDRSNRFRLEVSNIRQSDADWADFDQFLATNQNFPITHFVYDGNKLSHSFLSFISHSSLMTSLSVNGCLAMNDELITEFCRYLKRNRTLEELHICGSDKAILGASMRQVFDALKFNQHIHVLDFRHQRLGFNLIPMIENFFVQNKSVDELFIDDNSLLDIQSFEVFLAHMCARNWKLLLHVPSNDLLSLFKMNNISPSKAERLICLLHQLENCQDSRPFNSIAIAPIGEKVDPDEILYEIRDSFLEDTKWADSLNFALMADEMTHFQILDEEFDFAKLVQKLKQR
jgi:hypothetical protein